MTRSYYVAPIPPLHVLDGAAFATFTAYQDISPAPAIKIPANLLEVGTQIRLEAKGEFSTTGAPTLSGGFFWGTAAVPLGQSVLAATTTTAVSWPWHIEYQGRVRAIGTAGSINGAGMFDIGTGLTGMTSSFTPVTLALRTSAIDTSVEKVVGVGWQWGTSSASNTVKVNFFSVMLTS